MKKLLYILLFFMIVSCIWNDHIVLLNANDFKTEVFGKDVQLIDVRTPEEYSEGYIDDAVNIDFNDKDHFESNFSQFDKEKPIYVYCRSGKRSHETAKMLSKLGFEHIYDLEGGYLAWTENN